MSLVSNYPSGADTRYAPWNVDTSGDPEDAVFTLLLNDIRRRRDDGTLEDLLWAAEALNIDEAQKYDPDYEPDDRRDR